MSSALEGGLLAFDVDGTLLDPDGVLRPRTVAALRAAADAGAALTLATGRDWHAVTHLLRALPSVDYSLCVNGSEVVRSDGTTLRALEIDVDVVAAAIAHLRAVLPGVAMGLGLDGTLVAEPAIRGFLPADQQDIPVVDDVLAALAPGIRDVVIYHPDHRDGLGALVERVRAEVESDRLHVAYTGLPMAELVPPGSGKDAALAWLADHLGVSSERVVAFGDGMNDLGMLRAAGIGVAMGQATDIVRAAATEVTATNAEDGVAMWIESRLD